MLLSSDLIKSHNIESKVRRCKKQAVKRKQSIQPANHWIQTGKDPTTLSTACCGGRRRCFPSPSSSSMANLSVCENGWWDFSLLFRFTPSGPPWSMYVERHESDLAPVVLLFQPQCKKQGEDWRSKK
ncbi:uncharacterized protein LAJ45_09914 [Morchella importuna]|uniref:uncharacterized protein n=1 Tax=Morchella importuna TaxID=1174673 RepID=UPI001E8DDB0A|nr:uncharacterized protein LAJ45_09914 [Morchella importuna]KAH8145992.1 hypothetical protein LAJ45_09914 [Morchella importuna]